ncbi:fatty acyl-CoA hydrolase precursor, medium chain-like [Pristis pectinata]|uniref:fatty acyl-CoA hydrolase precursor, medium chain-like n=1 Tax=Pristis pectinata TaxID=685728 RepID=UPI00223C8E44|nr:fatty acyl-CoA hydrolase precursor, medium chain-like [Pristis pectinata]
MAMGGVAAVVAVLALASAADDRPPIVVTKYGPLEGKQVSVRGTTKPVYNYLGIPFAKPPVGPLRFSAPEPPEMWSGTRKATTFSPGCLQNSTVMDMLTDLLKINSGPKRYREDCLYLNVHTPVQPHDTETKLSVMVWIHGGGFMVGSGLFYDGSSLAAYEDVVVVVIQYRLGILGFLSTGDEHMKANLGMLDQIEALKWVQENIKSFGGDPSSVTIFGESAGGVSVSLLLGSPLAKGLFHRAISESGTALFEMVFNPDPKSTVQALANKTGCGQDTSWELVSCLRNKSEEEILNLTQTTLFAPIVVDGIFLTKDTEQLFEAKEFTVVPYMLGVTNHEAGWILSKMMNPPGWEEGMDKETSKMIINNTYLLTEENVQLSLDYYMGDTQDRVKIRDLHLELLGDVFMLVPTIRAARYCRDAGCPVYLYEFQHSTSIFRRGRPEFVKADHGDEILYVFGAAFWDGDISVLGNITAEEEALTRSIMSYWANFAKNGNPNGEGLVLWPAYDQNENYMQLNLKPVAGTKLKEHRMKFFTKILKHHAGEETEQSSTGNQCSAPTVWTEDGWLRGQQMEVEGSPRPVSGYLGIPFAAPPVGPLRFAAPQRPQPWTGIRNATSHPPMCLQKIRRVPVHFVVPASEDCLYLSVYTPTTATQHRTPIPVMVWIHGGAFILGRSSIFYGSALAGFGNVVVVVIQYRIGVAGFLSTGDEWARGNFGFLDQVAALQWVQRNIGQFGGDPQQVTLFGESVGGLSVSLHTLSPLSADLFHRAVLQSGSALMPGVLPPLPTQLAHEAAEIAGCSDTQSQLLLQCLRNKTEDEMSQITNSVNDLYQLIPVVVDGYFLPEDPQKMFQDGKFRKIPYLLGVTTEEGVKSLVHSEVIIKL